MALADTFIEIQEGLAEASFLRAAGAAGIRNDYLEGIEVLRRQREPVGARFRAPLAQAWQARAAGRTWSVKRALVRERADLSRVSEHELDVRLAARRSGTVGPERAVPERRLDRSRRSA